MRWNLQRQRATWMISSQSISNTRLNENELLVRNFLTISTWFYSGGTSRRWILWWASRRGGCSRRLNLVSWKINLTNALTFSHYFKSGFLWKTLWIYALTSTKIFVTGDNKRNCLPTKSPTPNLPTTQSSTWQNCLSINFPTQHIRLPICPYLVHLGLFYC